MIGDRIKEKQARMLASRLVESEAVEELCRVIATMERRQLEAVADLHDELDVEMLDTLPDVEERRENLQSLIGAMMGGDLEESLPEIVDAPAEEIDPYVGMAPEEWAAQVEAWAEGYREQAPDGALADADDRDLADRHVRNKWGVDLATFEGLIVEFDAAETAELVFTGNMATVRKGVERATREVSDDVGEEGTDAE